MHASSLIGIYSRDLFRDEVRRIRSQGDRDVEVLFIRFEGVANILGFLAETSSISGKVRAVVGVVQIIVFSSLGIFYWIRAYCWSEGAVQVSDFNYSDYSRTMVIHGAGNVVRGIVESCFQPTGNWLAIIYSLSGERMRYGCEEVPAHRNIFDVVVPSAAPLNNDD